MSDGDKKKEEEKKEETAEEAAKRIASEGSTWKGNEGALAQLIREGSVNKEGH